MTTTQTRLMAAVDPIARRLGYYTAYELDKEERIGYVKQDPITTRESLLMDGYEFSPTIAGVNLEAAKLHPGTGKVHEVSLRKVDPQNERMQYHIHLWGDRTTSIFSHHEFRPDICVLDTENVAEAKERLDTHYRPDWSTDDYVQGKACEVVEGMV